jgi:sugar lactone lactonase YvrE
MRPVVAAALVVLFTAGSALAQPPSDPALLIPQKAPALEYVAVPSPLTLPDGVTMGAAASVAFTSDGHLIVLNRGPQALMEFDSTGRFVRAFGDGLFTRTHGLHVDHDDNLWVADVGSHIVVKLDRQGRTLLTLGTAGEAGEWNEAAGSRKLNQPNDVAVDRDGNIFVVQGHTPGTRGDPRVLSFDRAGRFIRSWGGKGTGPGQFDVAHGIAIDARGLLWVTDRENQRIQMFAADGTFVREVKYAGLPCGIDIGERFVFMVNGFTGQIVQLDLEGNVIAALGRPGKGPGEFGEAHFIAVSPAGEIYVADTVNRDVQKFVRK